MESRFAVESFFLSAVGAELEPTYRRSQFCGEAGANFVVIWKLLLRANEDEEKRTGCRTDELRLCFLCQCLNRQSVDQGCGFRLTSEIVDWQGHASGKRARSPVTKVRRIVSSPAIKSLFSSRSTSTRPSRSLRETRRRQQVVKRHCLCDNLVSGIVSPRLLKSFAWPMLVLYRLIAGFLELADFSLILKQKEHGGGRPGDCQVDLCDHETHPSKPPCRAQRFPGRWMDS